MDKDESKKLLTENVTKTYEKISLVKSTTTRRKLIRNFQ